MSHRARRRDTSYRISVTERSACTLTAMLSGLAATVALTSGSASAKLIDAVDAPLMVSFALAFTFAVTLTVPFAVCCA